MDRGYLALQLELTIVLNACSSTSVFERLDLHTRSLPLGLRSLVIHTASLRPKGTSHMCAGNMWLQVPDRMTQPSDDIDTAAFNYNIHKRLPPVNSMSRLQFLSPFGPEIIALAHQSMVAPSQHDPSQAG